MRCLFGPPGGRKDFPRFTLRFRYAGFCCSDFIHSRRDFLADLSPFGFERFDNYRAHDHHDFIAIGVMCAQLAALGRIESTLEQSAQDRGVDLAPVALSGAEQLLRSEEHTSELQSLMRVSYAVFCYKKNKKYN